MAMCKRFARVFLFLSLFFPVFSRAIVYGSESAVSVLPAVTFPSIDIDNTMLGFGWFKNGITLEDSSTTCTFRSVYPVSGTLNMNGGALYLQDDFIMTNTSSIVGSAKIVGNTHTMQLCSSLSSFTSTYTFQDVVLVLSSDIELEGQFIFGGNCRIMGNRYHIEFAGGGSILVANDSLLTFDNLDLDGVTGTNIACANDGAQLLMHDTEWRQSGDFTFDKGRLEFSENVTFMGSYTFWYDSSQTSTIDSEACWIITDGMTLKMGRKNAVGYVEPIHFTDETSTIKLDNCSLVVTGSGIGLATGAFEMDRAVSIDVLSSSTSNGLIIGTGSVGGDFSMKLNPAVVVSLLAGWWVYNNTSSSGKLNALSPASQCIRYANSQFCVQKDWVIPPMIFQLLSGVQGAIIEPGASLSYDQSLVVTTSGKMYVTAQDQSNSLLLAGNDEIYVTEGLEPFPLIVSGSNNRLHGAGRIIAPITLQDNNASLCCRLNGLVDSDITMNGGTLMLDDDLNLGFNVILSGSGVVDLSTQDFALHINGGTWSDALKWDGNPGAVKLNSDVSLIGTWTFTNDCELVGGGHILDLTGGGRLVIDAHSTLRLHDLVLKGVVGQSVECLSDTSVLELNNVQWAQSASYTFATGSINVLGKNVLEGAYSFTYDSSQTSTIQAESRLALKNDMALWIGRKLAVGYVEPLYFVDNTSVLDLNNCSFVVTATGMSVTRGKVELNGGVSFSSLALAPAQGLELGDGVAGHDITYQYGSGGSLQFKSGWLVYNGYSPNCFVASSEGSMVTRYVPTGLWLKRPWLYPRMRLRILGPGSQLLATGGVVTFNNSKMLFDTVEFETTGQLIATTQFRLAGSQSLFLTKGAFPAYLFIQGANNSLGGTGDVAGPIIFQDSSAQLICNLSGSLGGYNVTLNGGTLSLANDLSLVDQITLTGTGTVDLNGHQFDFGTDDQVWTSTLLWQDGSIALASQVTLKGTWTFEGNCIVQGGGNMLDLNATGKLIIADGATVAFRNMRISGISVGQVQCLGASSTIILDDVVWEQDGDYLFSQGKLQVLRDVVMRGNCTFAYQSGQSSTIFDAASLTLDQGFTFSYDPIASAAQDLLTFETSNASLIINGATLCSTVTGLVLTRGRVEITKNSTFFAQTETGIDGDGGAYEIDEGITFGDGTSLNDLTLVLGAGATLSIQQGSLRYNNIDASSLQMQNTISALYMASGTKLKLLQTMNLGSGTCILGEGATLLIAAGKTLIGATMPLGQLVRLSL